MRAAAPAEASSDVIFSSTADLFCSKACYDMDTQAKSASALRRALFERERGICRACGLDCSSLARRMAAERSRARRRRMALEAKPEFGERGGKALLEQLVRTAWEGHAWHFDHVVAVKDGGGACTVENGQTLCVLCHKKRTAEQKKRWAEERKRKRARAEEDTLAKDEPVLSDRPVLSDLPSAEDTLAKDRPADGKRPSTVPPVEIIIDEDDEVISETESEGEARDARGGTEPAPRTQDFSGRTALFPDHDEDARDEPKSESRATGGYLLSDDEDSQDLMDAGLW